MTDIYVLCWNYRDNRNKGTIKAFDEKKEAIEMLKTLYEHGDKKKEFEVITLNISEKIKV